MKNQIINIQLKNDVIEPNELVKIIKYCSPEYLNKELELYNIILNIDDTKDINVSPVPFKRIKMVENLTNCIIIWMYLLLKIKM